jgi:hypothetical protein
MKTINPVTVWYGGQEIEATILNAVVQSDNLQNSASFQYQLMQLIVSGPDSVYAYPQPVVTNYLTMSGEAYEAWGTNDFAYEWIAEQLNLTITGEWNPPVYTTTTSTTTEYPSPTTTTSTTVAPE